MSKVICTLPNASDVINGVKFSRREDGAMVSDEISDDQAEAFASIPGYELDGAEPEDPPTTKAPPAPPAPKPAKGGGKKAAAEPAPAPEPDPETPPEPEVETPPLPAEDDSVF